MYHYLLDGVVHPERAQIRDHAFAGRFDHIGSGTSATMTVRILMNHVAAWVDSEVEWGTWDLRNIARYFVQLELNAVGFLIGHAYHAEIRRIICRELNVDQVFGVDMPCIVEFRKDKRSNWAEGLAEIKPKLEGDAGMRLHVCLNDLNLALRDVENVGFWCYRAIEALRHHCVATHSIDPKDKAAQWMKLREIAGCTEADTRLLQSYSNDARHGEPNPIPEAVAVNLLTTAWKIADAYIKNC